MSDDKFVEAGEATRGRDAASNSALPHAAPAGSEAARPGHRRHESPPEAGERSRDSAKPYTADTEPYEDPSLDDPRDPDQRADARRGPIA